MTAKTTSGPVGALLERLRADGGRYLILIGLTSEEYRAQPEPTYGGKGRSRFLTEEEHRALCAALESEDTIRTQLSQATAQLEQADAATKGAEHALAVCQARIRVLEEACALGLAAWEQLFPNLKHGVVQDYELVCTKAPLAMRAALTPSSPAQNQD